VLVFDIRPMKRERDPTPEELEKLIHWLATADRDYVAMHTRLTRVFIGRNCIAAEDLSDEVLNRVAVRIDELKEKYPDPIKCLLGFVGNVEKEYKRDPTWDRPKRPDLDPPLDMPAPDPRKQAEDEFIKELKDNCLAKCLEQLSQTERDLFCRYFQDDQLAKHTRKKLAEDLVLTANALRIRAHRLRTALRECLENCLAETVEN
jgi:DNA-directed RNA polymerase specialized sigma24 family protein